MPSDFMLKGMNLVHRGLLAVSFGKLGWDAAGMAVLDTFDRPFLCAFSDGDPFSPGGEKPFMRRVPGVAGQAHTTIVGASHFVQEDTPDEVVFDMFMETASSPVRVVMTPSSARFSAPLAVLAILVSSWMSVSKPSALAWQTPRATVPCSESVFFSVKPTMA